MSLTKGFIRSHRKPKRKWLITAILLGLNFAIVLYPFFYCVRECVRISSTDHEMGVMIILSPFENFLYNWFFASISTVFGFYIFSKFYIENSINHLRPRVRLRQRQSLNDQSFYIWGFLYVFTKVGSIYSIWYLAGYVQFDIDFLSEFWLVLILAPLVLFLIVWIGLNRSMHLNSGKSFLLCFGPVLTISLILSNWNLWDYQKVDEKLKAKSIPLSYQLELPRTKSFSRLSPRHTSLEIFIIYDSISGENRIFANDPVTELNLKQLSKWIEKEWEKFSEVERNSVPIILFADGRVPMKLIDDIKQEFRKLTISRVNFSTAPRHSNYPWHYPNFRQYGISTYLFPYYRKLDRFLDQAESMNFQGKKLLLSESLMYRNGFLKSSNRIEARITKKDIMVNNSKIEKKDLEDFLFHFIRKFSPDEVIIFNYNEDISFGRYIEVFDIINYTYERLRNEITVEKTGMTYEELDFHNPEYRYLKSLYPRHILEWTREEKRLIKLQEKIMKQNLNISAID